MKVSDYIVQKLASAGITDAFGYPGAVICHLMDSMANTGAIKMHLNYHEQGSAFCACGSAAATGRIGFAYSNGGPGATNLVTGVANAYYDSQPVIFIAGQVDMEDSIGDLPIRQRGIQEIPIQKMMEPICKFAAKVEHIEDIRYYIERACWEANHGRPGPCVLEIPANIQRAEVDVESLKMFEPVDSVEGNVDEAANCILDTLEKAKRPCFLIGNGLRNTNYRNLVWTIAEKHSIPCVFSLPALDMLAHDDPINLGFIGMNGHRYSNFVLGKADAIIALGSRLDLKQVGVTRTNFAPHARLVRVDIDAYELCYKVRDNELSLCCDLNHLLPAFVRKIPDTLPVFSEWLDVCHTLKKELYGYDFSVCHQYIHKISQKVSFPCCVTADVGQHEIYVAQAFVLKKRQRLFLSLGLASMGFSLPAAMGAAYASRKPVLAFCGDGGIQMNIQELQALARDNLPVKVIIINNYALGMIREFQERNFQKKCTQSVQQNGYTIPNFEKIAHAYNIDYVSVETLDQIDDIDFNTKKPGIIEIMLHEDTYLTPRLVRGMPISYMVPEMDS